MTMSRRSWIGAVMGASMARLAPAIAQPRGKVRRIGEDGRHHIVPQSLLLRADEVIE